MEGVGITWWWKEQQGCIEESKTDMEKYVNESERCVHRSDLKRRKGGERQEGMVSEGK